jgi:hypothetical protein
VSPDFAVVIKFLKIKHVECLPLVLFLTDPIDGVTELKQIVTVLDQIRAKPDHTWAEQNLQEEQHTEKVLNIEEKKNLIKEGAKITSLQLQTFNITFTVNVTLQLRVAISNLTCNYSKPSETRIF